MAMNKRVLTAAIAALPLCLMAQTAMDAYQMSRYDLRGTARYMSMAGAFGALGGDLSTLNQNPGGIGVYRKSDVGITLDIDMQNSKSITPLQTYKQVPTLCRYSTGVLHIIAPLRSTADSAALT